MNDPSGDIILSSRIVFLQQIYIPTLRSTLQISGFDFFFPVLCDSLGELCGKGFWFSKIKTATIP
jgi:hypothetical protein